MGAAETTGKQPIRTRYLSHVTGYKPIREHYFLIRSNSLIRSRDWLSANQGSVFLDSIGSCFRLTSSGRAINMVLIKCPFILSLCLSVSVSAPASLSLSVSLTLPFTLPLRKNLLLTLVCLCLSVSVSVPPYLLLTLPHPFLYGVYKLSQFVSRKVPERFTEKCLFIIQIQSDPDLVTPDLEINVI
eukprot:sb/3471351/